MAVGLENLAEDALEALATPRVSLPAMGHVIDQKTGKTLRFNPHAITHKLQETILSYVSDAPRTEIGQTHWLALLGYRQAGKSLTAELGGYPHAAYRAGWDHACIADRKERAEYLHQRLHVCHKNWPAEFRSPTRASNEVRQLTFENGSRMRVLSGESGAVGIGQSPDFFHGSELPYWTDAGGQMSLIIPSMINRDHGLMVLESTPAPMDEPSAEWWRDHYFEAKKGVGRWLSAFFPFWDGKLNQRPWPKGAQPDLEELRLLERYGPSGLGYEHLAFRRELMQSDRQIRRNPDLFGVYYPFDDSSCWLASSSGVIHRSILERHRKRALTPWEGRADTFHYVEYEPPDAGAVYLVCVDPVGWGARDHGSFHVLKCYVGEWTQVAVGSGITDPVDLANAVEKAHLRYGGARIAVERNGPGEGFLGMLIQKGIRNIHYDDKAKPGVWKHSDSEMLAQLIDALRDELVLNDQDTLDQLLSYKNDKVVEKSVKAEIMASRRRDKRRGRHHWDKVSALAVGVIAARGMPRRYKPETNSEPQNVVLFKDMTWNQVEKYRQQVNRDQSKRGRKRSGRARYTRKRRK